jgi:acetyl esterase/lipase
MSFRFALALLLAPSALFAQSWTDPAAWAHVPEPTATKDIVYFAPTDPIHDPNYDPKSQRLDVYQNAAATPAAKAPVLVYIHGGAWNHGEKPTSWHGFRPWIAAGFSVVNVEYRLVDAAPAPAAVQDVRCVLSWIKQNAAKFNFDASRVVTYGTSAGGHLALLAAILPANNDIDLPQCRAQPHISAVLDFYGPYHLEPTQPGAFTSPSTARWILGTKPGPGPQPSLEAKEHAMSPSTYVRAGIPPVFIAQGDADPTVPYAASVTLQKDLEKLGVKNMFDTVPGGGHGKWPPDQQQRVELDSLKFLQANGVIP